MAHRSPPAPPLGNGIPPVCCLRALSQLRLLDMPSAHVAMAAATTAALVSVGTATTALTLLPELGISREGKTCTFRSNLPVSWSVVSNSGRASYTLLTSTPQALSLQAGSTGGGEFTVLAKLLSCAAAQPAATSMGAGCTASASWHILAEWQFFLVAAMLCFGVSAGVFNAYRLWRVSQETQDKRRVVLNRL